MSKNDDARITGLANILKSSNKQKEIPPSPAPTNNGPAVAEPGSAAPRRAKREQVGKYRDPKYHHYGVYLRKDTHKRVKRRLEDSEAGKDVSELLQELLEQWLASE